MNLRPRLLDLFCCQGGAGMGYARSGFDVTGVDNVPQPRYPFPFVQADALEYLAEHGHEYDVIHASPPCQAYTLAQRIQGNRHPDMIAETRELLQRSGVPYVIENVVGAPLLSPMLLCGAVFGLQVYRHRLFESSVYIPPVPHIDHAWPLAKMGRPVLPGYFMHVVGNFSGVAQAREAMRIDWMSRDGLREAIPPAYTEEIGSRILSELAVAA